MIYEIAGIIISLTALIIIGAAPAALALVVWVSFDNRASNRRVKKNGVWA